MHAVITQSQIMHLVQKLQKQLTYFREDTTSIISDLTKRKGRYNSTKHLMPEEFPGTAIRTQEGSSPINQLIGELIHMEDLQPIDFISELGVLAQILLRKIFSQGQPKSQIGQDLYQGFRQKLQNEIDKQHSYPDPLVFVPVVALCTEKQPLLSLLIDDGNFDRKTRILLLDKQLKYGGVAAEQWKTDKNFICCIYILTASRESKEQPQQ